MQENNTENNTEDGAVQTHNHGKNKKIRITRNLRTSREERLRSLPIIIRKFIEYAEAKRHAVEKKQDSA